MASDADSGDEAVVLVDLVGGRAWRTCPVLENMTFEVSPAVGSALSSAAFSSVSR